MWMKIRNLWKYSRIFHFQHGILELNQVIDKHMLKLPMYYGIWSLWNTLVFRYEKKNFCDQWSCWNGSLELFWENFLNVVIVSMPNCAGLFGLMKLFRLMPWFGLKNCCNELLCKCCMYFTLCPYKRHVNHKELLIKIWVFFTYVSFKMKGAQTL
jgi:hypothetical protein